MAEEWKRLQGAWGRRAASAIDTAHDSLELCPRLHYYRPSGAAEHVRFVLTQVDRIQVE